MSRDFLVRSSSRSNAIRRRSTSGLLEESVPKESPPPSPQSEVETQGSSPKLDTAIKAPVKTTTPGFIPFCVDNLEINNYQDLKRAIQHHQEMATMLSQYATNMGYVAVQKM